MIRRAWFAGLTLLPLVACDSRPPINETPLEGVDLQLRARARMAGDIDGDGLDDLLVWNDPRDPGRVAVLMGRASTGVLTPEALMSGSEGLVVESI